MKAIMIFRRFEQVGENVAMYTIIRPTISTLNNIGINYITPLLDYSDAGDSPCQKNELKHISRDLTRR
jgi:hypothetical protein